MNTRSTLLTLNRAACLTAALFALSACATTDTASMDDATMVASADATAKTAEADDGMICKKTTVVGSKFNKKVCATQAEWDARAAADREATENLQRGKAPGVSN